MTFYVESNPFLVLLECFLLFWRLLWKHVSLSRYCLQRPGGASMSSPVSLQAASWSSSSCSQSGGILGSDTVLVSLKYRKSISSCFASHLLLLWKLHLHCADSDGTELQAQFTPSFLKQCPSSLILCRLVAEICVKSCSPWWRLIDHPAGVASLPNSYNLF